MKLVGFAVCYRPWPLLLGRFKLYLGATAWGGVGSRVRHAVLRPALLFVYLSCLFLLVPQQCKVQQMTKDTMTIVVEQGDNRPYEKRALCVIGSAGFCNFPFDQRREPTPPHPRPPRMPALHLPRPEISSVYLHGLDNVVDWEDDEDWVETG